MKRARLLLTPATVSDFSKESRLTYWKQVLPQKNVDYIDRKGRPASVDFNEHYLSKLMSSFGSLDQTAFLLADRDNAHTMDPERMRAEVTELRLANPGESPGLYAKIVFGSRKAAKAVLENPRLGVSARIREEADGPKLIHVLGTLDPQVTGMAPWKPIDLSTYATDRVLDLSKSAFSEGDTAMGKLINKTKKRDIDSYTEDEIEAMTDDELEAFLTEFAPGALDITDTDDDASDLDDDTDDDDDEDDDAAATDSDYDEADDASTDDEDDDVTTPALNLSKKRRSRDIELANSAAATANARASEALRRMAEAEWNAAKSDFLSKGVPPHLLDLAEPVLNRPDDMVIDLSHADEDDVNVSDIVRGLLEATEGTIDLTDESGHFGSTSTGDDDPDEPLLAAWSEQYPAAK